jgi:hypothetical protein
LTLVGLGSLSYRSLPLFRPSKLHLLLESSYLSEDEKKEIATLKKEAREIFAQLVYERATQNTYNRLYSSLNRCRNLATIDNLIGEIVTLTTTGGLTTKESLELKAVAFGQQQVLTDYKLDKTQEIILNELLPLCLCENTELSMQYSAFRNILADWITNHPQQEASIIRNLILDNLVELIGTIKHRPVCWTISRLGFARPDVVQKLLDFAVNADDDIGDDTLSTLTWLTLSQDQRKITLNELHSRVEKRFNNSLVWSLARLGNSTSFPVIMSQWLQTEEYIKKGVDASLAFTAIREIADANDNDESFQDLTWRETSNLVEQNHQTLYFSFEIGHLVEACNSTLVIPTMLRWHGQHPEWFKNPGWARFLTQGQLETAVKPLQLEGWTHIENQAVFDVLQKDACSDSGNDIYAPTEASILKESAWKTVLRTGYLDALNWFEPAVAVKLVVLFGKRLWNTWPHSN